MSVFKNKGQKGKRVLSGCWYQWDGEGWKEMVKEGKYGGNIMYLCMKMEDLLKLF
jgi:hypothetical protein